MTDSGSHAYTFRPAVRENTPLIIGIAGPTKSGKTYSALRLAAGLAPAGPVVMLNAEGARGHQYADKFKYLTCDLSAPFRATRYTEALREAAKLDPGLVIIDSVSHMHDGPGGTIEWHEEELDRLAGNKPDRDRYNFSAWIAPKAAENKFIYTMLALKCPFILCMRAKEKLRLVPGKAPVDLGWQPIVGERVAFETIFTLTLPPHSKGVPDLTCSELREPFDTLIPAGRALDEDLGRKLAKWAAGTRTPAQRVETARSILPYSDEEWTRLVTAKLGGPLDAAPEEELTGTLIPFLVRLAKKDELAIAEAARLVAP